MVKLHRPRSMFLGHREFMDPICEFSLRANGLDGVRVQVHLRTNEKNYPTGKTTPFQNWTIYCNFTFHEISLSRFIRTCETCLTFTVTQNCMWKIIHTIRKSCLCLRSSSEKDFITFLSTDNSNFIVNYVIIKTRDI